MKYTYKHGAAKQAPDKSKCPTQRGKKVVREFVRKLVCSNTGKEVTSGYLANLSMPTIGVQGLYTSAIF